MKIRKAVFEDICAVGRIYDEIHTAEESGRATIGWVRGVYPTKDTARAAFERGDLFVQEDDGKIVGAAIINHIQCYGYKDAAWQYSAPDHRIMVLHTLVVSPSVSGRGYGKVFISFYEEYAGVNGCRFLRMDTNERNVRVRMMYKRLGYREIGIIPTVFNGISGVNLVLLEKTLEQQEG